MELSNILKVIHKAEEEAKVKLIKEEEGEDEEEMRMNLS